VNNKQNNKQNNNKTDILYLLVLMLTPIVFPILIPEMIYYLFGDYARTFSVFEYRMFLLLSIINQFIFGGFMVLIVKKWFKGYKLMNIIAIIFSLFICIILLLNCNIWRLYDLKHPNLTMLGALLGFYCCLLIMIMKERGKKYEEE